MRSRVIRQACGIPARGLWAAQLPHASAAEVERLRLEPLPIFLEGPGSSQRFIVTGITSSGDEADVTASCEVSPHNESTVAAEAGKLVGTFRRNHNNHPRLRRSVNHGRNPSRRGSDASGRRFHARRSLGPHNKGLQRLVVPRIRRRAKTASSCLSTEPIRRPITKGSSSATKAGASISHSPPNLCCSPNHRSKSPMAAGIS